MDATDLAFIPRTVRDKLDRATIKLHLVEWQALSWEERRELCELPCTEPEKIAQFREQLGVMMRQR